MKKITFTIDEKLFSLLQRHLFPGDNDEHGAVIASGISEDEREVRFLARELFLAKDGRDYLPGRVGYRCLSAEFVANTIGYCSDRNLCYFAVHCHSGENHVEFSSVDLASHDRGYPALLDISHGGPVGGLVFAKNAVAGDVWTHSQRYPLDYLTIVGPKIYRIYPDIGQARTVSKIFDRHVRLFGDAGQHILSNLKVGIIGLGGGGSLINEWISRLGVGEIVAIDDEKIEPTNLPRVVGATNLDAMVLLANSNVALLQTIGTLFSRSKVTIARRVAKRARRAVIFHSVKGNVLDVGVARRLRNCDFIFLATDNIQSRLVFNALVHQYLIPGAQIGIKISFDKDTNKVESILANTRLVLPYPGGGCLECHELIPPSRLAEEALAPEQRRRQRYVDSEEVPEPSVITLNVLSASTAVNDLMMLFMGLYKADVSLSHIQKDVMDRQTLYISPTVNEVCPDCSAHPKSRKGKGDRMRLPCWSSEP